MRSTCRRHSVAVVVAALAWTVVVVGAFWVQPDAHSMWRLPWTVVLAVAMNATILAGMPYMLRGFVKDQTLAYVAGYMHREVDEPVEERPRLEVVR
jgi:hypothetical protein